MTSSVLPRLLAAGLIHVGDKVFFKFKKHTYEAVIAAGGLVTQCTANGTNCLGVYHDLQTWCEECITEVGGEYVQRFASSRRVKHRPTGRSFTQLRELMGTATTNAEPCRCAESLAQRRRVLELEQQLRVMQQKFTAPEPMCDDNPFLLKF